MSLRIGFISTRLAGTDGVSLETEKWAAALEGMGHECFYFAGECSRPPERTSLIPEAHFTHPEVLDLTHLLFDSATRSVDVSRRVERLKEMLKGHLKQFVERFDLNLWIAENALSLPVHVPLGLALTEFIAETSLPTVAHHHDFSWERKRFSIHAAGDYLRAAFPPYLPSLRHVVINSFAARQLALRTGASSILIPNVMDFEHPPPSPDDAAASLRQALGLESATRILLQPTRVVPRKRIELAIELTRRLEEDCALVISHASGDEGSSYEMHLRAYAGLLGARVVFAANAFGHHRRRRPDGSMIYSLADIYQQAGLVTYPSTVEGFGNAFLETVYYRRPLVMSTYEIFRTDIQPKGFRVIGFDDFISDETVVAARAVLDNPALAAEMTEHNFTLGRRFYSFSSLERHLAALMSEVAVA